MEIWQVVVRDDDGEWEPYQPRSGSGLYRRYPIQVRSQLVREGREFKVQKLTGAWEDVLT